MRYRQGATAHCASQRLPRRPRVNVRDVELFRIWVRRAIRRRDAWLGLVGSATWVCGTCRSRKVINYHNGGLRREVTVELVTQLNDMLTPGASKIPAVF